MKSKALKEMRPRLAARLGEKRAAAVMAAAEKRLEELRRENAADPKAVKAHTEDDIFPCISLYGALQEAGLPKEEALALLDESWSDRARPGAEATGRLLHFAGLYKLYPAMFRSVAKRSYGPAAGFEARFYDCGKQRCKFDMTRCLYLDTCRRCGCPELTVCFCHVDDINNENLHPRLCWNRTQFMGGGGELCDFDIFVTGKENKKP